MISVYKAIQANETARKELLKEEEKIKSRVNTPSTEKFDRLNMEIANKAKLYTRIPRIMLSVVLLLVYILIYGIYLQPKFEETIIGFISIIAIVASIVIPIMLINRNKKYESLKKSKKYTKLLK